MESSPAAETQLEPAGSLLAGLRATPCGWLAGAAVNKVGNRNQVVLSSSGSSQLAATQLSAFPKHYINTG